MKRKVALIIQNNTNGTRSTGDIKKLLQWVSSVSGTNLPCKFPQYDLNSSQFLFDSALCYQTYQRWILPGAPPKPLSVQRVHCALQWFTLTRNYPSNVIFLFSSRQAAWRGKEVQTSVQLYWDPDDNAKMEWSVSLSQMNVFILHIQKSTESGQPFLSPISIYINYTEDMISVFSQ